MIHVLLTPPDKVEEGSVRTTLENLGILQIGCLPEWTVRVLNQMDAEGWIVQAVDPAPFQFPVGNPNRKLGQKYFDDFMVAHPDLAPGRSD